MNKIRKEIKAIFEDVKFLPGQDDKLIGYAEMFGNDCIPLYKGINYTPCSTPEEAILKIQYANKKARTADGFNDCLIGHLKLDSGEVILLYNRESIINSLKDDYSKDKSGIFEDEDDIEISAEEYYSYNILGSYLDGIPAFAVLYSK